MAQAMVSGVHCRWAHNAWLGDAAFRTHRVDGLATGSGATAGVRTVYLSRVCLATLLLLVASAPETAGSAAERDESTSEPWLFRLWDPRTSPFIPIPEVGTDPNSGTTVGILPTYLSRDEQGHIRQIIAPDINFNPNLGFGAHFRIFSYPSKDTEWHAVAGGSERIERRVDLLYETGLTRQQTWSPFARILYDRSATQRFFGIGNDTPRSAETNYTGTQAYPEATIGFNFSPALQVALNERLRFVQIQPGTLGPSINPSLLGSENELLNQLLVTYDTRDSLDIPTYGMALVAFTGFANRDLLSSVSYSVAGFDARHFAPLDSSGRFTLAGHLAMRYMPTGSNPPFWVLSSIGGDRSTVGERQPLRGFGEGRFIDRNSFSATLELRTRVFDLNLFSTTLTFEAAPFLDAGRVFPHLTDNPINHLHLAGGMGFRGIAKPFIVGYVDVGYGGEGLAIFSGIRYPF